MKLNLEVRNNPLVTLFTAYVDGIGTLQQAAFQQTKPGIFTFSKDIAPTTLTLLVRFTIIGVGSDIQSPAGVCLIFFGDPPMPIAGVPQKPNYLKPYLQATITAGHTADTEDYPYPLTPAGSGGNQIPGFDQL